MRHLITIIFLLLTCQIFAQDNFPRVEKVVVDDKLFHGRIDKYPITIYLKYNQISNYHAGVYSVQGWYYYDNIKTKIPLSGLYDFPELIIYNFQDTSKSAELLNFRKMTNNHWDDMEYYKNLNGYQEKFVLTDSANYWINDKNKFEVRLENDDLRIMKVYEYLLLDSNTTFDLHSFGDWTWNFEIVAQKEGKFILHFEHASRLYVMGQCGAGLEKGFIQLDFDENNKLLLYEKFVYESCNGSISTEEKISEDKVTTYHCYNYMEEKSYDLKVDLKTPEINRYDRQTYNNGSKTEYDKILNEYSIIKQESIPSVKASIDIRLNREFNKSAIKKLAQKLKNDLKGDYKRIFISYYLPGMKAGSGAWATSHFEPDLKIIMTAPYFDDTKKIAKTDNSKTDKLMNEFISENGSVDILGKWSQGDGIMVVIFKKNNKYFLNEMEIEKLKMGKNWELYRRTKNGNQIFVIKALMGDGYNDYYLIEKNGKLSLYDNIGLYEQYDIVK